MTESEHSSEFTKILAEIRKLADDAINVAEKRRLKERDLSDESSKLSEKHRLAERNDSDEALDIAEEAVTLSEKRRLTERTFSDHAIKLGEKRRITEQIQSAEAGSKSKEMNDLEVSTAYKEIDKLNIHIIQILESLHETCLFFYDNRLIYITKQAKNLYWPKEKIIGKDLTELFPKDISELFFQKHEKDKSPIAILRFESTKFRDKKKFQFLFYPSEAGFLVCFNDITKMKQIKKESKQADNLNASKT